MKPLQKHSEDNKDGNSHQKLLEDEETFPPGQLLPDESYSTLTLEESQTAECVTEEEVEKESEESESGNATEDIKPLKGILKGITKSPKDPETLKKSVSFILDNLTSVVKERELYMEFAYHNFCTRLSALRPSLCPLDETGYVDADREYETEYEDTDEDSSTENTSEYESEIRKDKGMKSKKPKGKKVKRRKAKANTRKGGKQK